MVFGNPANTKEVRLMEQVIGRVAATKDKGNSSQEFYFWIAPETQINPLDLIVVHDKIDAETNSPQQQHTEPPETEPAVTDLSEEEPISEPVVTTQSDEEPTLRKVYAQILDITSYTDAESFLEVFASTDFGNVTLESDVDRVAYSVAKAQVLRTSGSIRMPVQFNSSVYLAGEADIMELLRVEELDEEYKLPIGYIEQSDVKVPVFMDARWLTGTDGAHLNVSGKSRLAAKTSYVLFLISSILQTQKDTAVIIFNVKGSDLLQIHKPNKLLEADTDDLSAEDKQKLEELEKAWETAHLSAQPFDEDKVYYFLPSHRNNPNRINSDRVNLPGNSDDITSLPDNYFVYRYSLDHAKRKLRLLLSSLNITDAQEAFISALDNSDDLLQYNTFIGLCTFLNNQADSIRQGRNRTYLNAIDSTVRVTGRHIESVTRHRSTGVFDYTNPTSESGQHKLPSDFIKKSLRAGQTLVVDIARVNPSEQQWVFADILTTVENIMAENIDDDSQSDELDKPKKVAIFVDELNKYAPSGRSSPLTIDLIDITSRGGSLGVILFGAEQFASRIHPEVYGNCTNKAFGLTDPTEAGTEPYRAFPIELKNRLYELERGELLIDCDFFDKPMRIKFPRPACRKQEDADSDSIIQSETTEKGEDNAEN